MPIAFIVRVPRLVYAQDDDDDEEKTRGRSVVIVVGVVDGGGDVVVVCAADHSRMMSRRHIERGATVSESSRVECARGGEISAAKREHS